jgi:hypothetical protein
VEGVKATNAHAFPPFSLSVSFKMILRVFGHIKRKAFTGDFWDIRKDRRFVPVLFFIYSIGL